MDFERLHELARRLPGVPLVQHGASGVPAQAVALLDAHGGRIRGASGVPEGLLRRAAASGVCKINIDTGLCLAVTGAVRKALMDCPEFFDPRVFFPPAGMP